MPEMLESRTIGEKGNIMDTELLEKIEAHLNVIKQWMGFFGVMFILALVLGGCLAFL